MGLSDLVALITVVSVALGTISRARFEHLWSWKAFGWTMLLVAAYLGLVLAASACVLWGGCVDAQPHPVWAVLCLMAPLLSGIVPVTIIAKRIQYRFVPEARVTPLPRSPRRGRWPSA
jgi:hypothetical protein